MLGLVVSTIVFFVASHFLRRWADANDLPKGMTRNISVFTLALAVSYCAAWVLDRIFGT